MTELLHPFGGAFLRPPRPRLREALGAVTALDDALLDEALAAPRFDWTPQNGLEWQQQGPDGTVRPRWSGRPRHGAHSPAEAWECLAARGVIPDAWVGATPARRFHWSHDGASPSDVRACIALASDPEGITLVEHLAREMVARLAPWLSDRGVRLLWKVVRLRDEENFLQPAYPPGGPVLWAALGALEDPYPRMPTKRRRGVVDTEPTPVPPARMWDRVMSRPRVLQAGQRLDALLAGWARRAADTPYPATVQVGGAPVAVPRSLWGQPAGYLGDFSEPLGAIVARGYAVEWLGQRTLTLVAPDIA